MAPLTSRPTITSTSPPPATIGAPYSYTLSATGGTPPYTWKVSKGKLPSGLKLTSGTIAGTPKSSAITKTFTVKVTDAKKKTATASLTIVIGLTPTQLAFTTEPSSTATSDTAFPVQPVVSVETSSGTVVTTYTSSVTLSLNESDGATLICSANPTTTSSGVATFAGCQVDLVGTYTLTATDGSLTSSASTSFTISPGVAAQLAFTTQPYPGETESPGTPFSVDVAEEDAAGNVVTSDSSNSVSLALTSDTSNGATLDCATNPVTLSQGVADFSCSIAQVGIGYIMEASSPSAPALGAVDSYAFNVGSTQDSRDVKVKAASLLRHSPRR